MDLLSISSLHARDLPRSLLRAPSPCLEFHTTPASPPHTTLPPPPQNTTSPSWRHTISHTLPSYDATIGFVVRDSPYPHPPLAHLTISPRRALTQGWFPLSSHDNHPAGELFLSLLCPTRCAARPIPHTPAFPPIPLSNDTQHEKRVVSKQPGRLFRSGRLRIAITAHGIPVTATPFLKLVMADQVLVGAEFQPTQQSPQSASPSQTVSQPPQQSSDTRKLSDAVMENLLRTGLRKGKRLEPVGKTLLKTAHALRTHSQHDVAQSSDPQRDSEDQLQALQLENLQVDEDAIESTDQASAEPGATPMRRFSFRKHGVNRTLQPKQETTQVSERYRRRPVDFGSFELALFHGVTPTDISIQIHDASSRLPERLSMLTDQNIQLPDLTSLKCTCDKQCNTHLLAFQMSDRGDQDNKIILQITVERKTWASIATDTIVTPRFRQVMSSIDDMADTFKDRFPDAENLTYLLVGGLFTKHYPTYFEKNKQFLQEKLRLPRVQAIPIHTEGSIARNAKIIRDSILKTCRGSKSIVLIGHSKGGIDAVAILDSFPETRRFLYGIVTFQAPFGGTFLVDFVARSKLAVSAISSVIEVLWKGDQESLLDMSYSARAKSLKLNDTQCESSTEVIPNNPEANSIPTTSSSMSPVSLPETTCQSKPESTDHDNLDVYRQVPIVAIASYASFHILSIRSAANAAGVASMAPAAQRIVKHTGFLCDGLVTAGDARIPHADTVLLEDMMHTEPALYVQGTRYPPGQLTASALVLLFEKLARNTQS